MKHTLPLLLVAALCTAGSSQAGIILGWHNAVSSSPPLGPPPIGADQLTQTYASDFNGTVYPHPIVATGSLKIFGPSAFTTDAGGSTDGSYGNYPGIFPSPGTASDGQFVLPAGQYIELWAVPTERLNLDRLYFDWFTGTSPIALELSYKINSGSYISLGNPTFSTGDTGQFASTDFDLRAAEGTAPGAGYDGGFYVNPGDTFILRLRNDTLSTIQLDNIALSAIPEVGTALALGGLLSTGILIRQRPKPTVVKAS